MNETKDNKLSARSKVMDSWNSGWKTISKTPPILAIPDIELSRSHKTIKSDKKNYKDFNKIFDPTKVITKENNLKILSKNKKMENNRQKDKQNEKKDISKNSSKEGPNERQLNDNSKDNSKEKSKEIRNKSNATQMDDNSKKSSDESSAQKVSILGKTDSKDNESKNSFISKLRKRKMDSKSPSVDTESHIKTVSLTKSNIETEIKAKESTEKMEENEITPEKRTDLNQPENEVQQMEVDSTTSTTFTTCIRPDCYKEINRFYLFEGKYCSSKCAIKQWTENFHNWVL